MNIHHHKVKRFRNCPNPDCSVHYPPSQFDDSLVPDNRREQLKGKLLMACMHCNSVWYEEQHTNSRAYHIVRNSANNWPEYPWIEIYTLPKHRKPKLQ